MCKVLRGEPFQVLFWHSFAEKQVTVFNTMGYTALSHYYAPNLSQPYSARCVIAERIITVCDEPVVGDACDACQTEVIRGQRSVTAIWPRPGPAPSHG